MSIGARIAEVRHRKGMTQQELSKRSGIASSYLSRIEKRRLEPGPTTLLKIAQALETSLSDLFQERPLGKPAARCPVSVSGECIMELLDSGKRRLPPGAERYSPRQLQLLREAAYLIQTANDRLLDTLDLLFGALVSAPTTRAKRHTTPKAR